MTPGDLHPPLAAVREAVSRAIAEDVLPLGDLTAGLVDPGHRVRAAFVSRAAGVVAGRLCAAEAFHQVDPAVHAEKSRAAGADAFFHKPAESAQLLAEIHRLLGDA